jgi:membrane-associated protease RseP (regulator of RpoE activity)
VGGAVATIVAFIVFILAHEAGHFFAAKALGIKVTEFFVGFGPRIWSIRKGETEYGIKAIPAGGYVRIVGMSVLEEIDPEDIGRTYRERKFWEKSVVVLSGIAANFLIAYLIFVGLLLANGVAEPQPVVDRIAAELEDGTATPAALSDLEEGDRFVSIDGVATPTWEAVASTLSTRPGETVDVVIDRAGREVVLTVTLATVSGGSDTQGYLGVGPVWEPRDVGFFSAAGMGGRQVIDLTGRAYGMLWDLFKPSTLAKLAQATFGGETVPDEIRPVSVIGIAQAGSQVDRIGVDTLVFFLGAFNIILAAFNVLPFLPLDGGHFAIALYERVTHREANIQKLVPVAATVIALMVFVGFIAMYLDIVQPIRF